ncbi:MAG: 4Fe-4S binding protein [Chloroflexota bacterium]
MTQDIYRKLAQRLDAIPNGYPPTESGVELRLLEKIFTPEEAALASVMRLTTEPSSQIAPRAGMDSEDAYQLLKNMTRKGLIRAKKEGSELQFGLMPFVVGIYEEQLPRLDTELAQLFEQYMQEINGGILREKPSLHRVIPVGEAISFDLEIFPYEQAHELIESAKSWGVRKCICRAQQHLIGKGCDHRIDNCLFFAPVEGAFGNSEVSRVISREEALQILHESEEAGLVHTVANHQSRHFYICNCCTCCCGILRGIAEFDIPTAVARSNFRAVVESDICNGCLDCVGRCQFEALSVPDMVCEVDLSRCVGCGVCTIACSTGALRLERRPEEEITTPPGDIKEWMLQRAIERKIPIQEIL